MSHLTNRLKKSINGCGVILCFGDSNTWGYDPRSYLGGQYPKDVRWTGILDLETDWLIFNHGQNGREIPHDTSRIRSAVNLLSGECERLAAEMIDGMEVTGERADASTYPVWLWIMLGSNDLLMNRYFRAEDVAARMEEFLKILLEDERLQRKAMNVNVRLIAPPAMQKGTWIDEERLIAESGHLGDVEKALAERLNIAFTDMSSIYIPVSYDGVHLSPEGHRVFAEEMKKCL